MSGEYIASYVYVLRKTKGSWCSRIPMDSSDGSCNKNRVVCRKSFGFGQVADVVLRGEQKKKKNHRLKVYRDLMGSQGRFVYENLHEWLILYGKCR